jgi:hypothetical protein
MRNIFSSIHLLTTENELLLIQLGLRNLLRDSIAQYVVRINLFFKEGFRLGLRDQLQIFK